MDIPSRGPGTNWDTLGSVPDSPGLHLFTLEDTDELRVVCAGRTDHLWGPMVLVDRPSRRVRRRIPKVNELCCRNSNEQVIDLLE